MPPFASPSSVRRALRAFARNFTMGSSARAATATAAGSSRTHEDNVDSPDRCSRHAAAAQDTVDLPMASRADLHRLLEQLAESDPELVAAVDDVDLTLIDS